MLNRAFYGVPDLTNAQGLHTNAIYGFLNIMFKVLEEENPDFLAVAFDVHAPTFRHEMYDAYKGTRKPMPEELRQQVPVMKEVLNAMGILTVEKAGLEADDILGTLAKQAEKAEIDVALVSGDRDLLQIATDKIKIRIPKTKGGRTEVEDYYAKDVKEAYQVTPVQFIELKALMGDTADNIPGVPKVGQKTATELMCTYGSIDGIYDHIDEISKKSIRESLMENRDLAELSLRLATIKTDCEIPYTFEDAKIGDFYTAQAYALFKKLEFKNFLNRFDKSNGEQEIAFTVITEVKALKTLTSNIIASKEADVALMLLPLPKHLQDKPLQENEQLVLPFLQPESSANSTKLYGAAIAHEKGNYFIKIDEDAVEGLLRQSISDMMRAGKNIVTFDVKNQYRYLENQTCIEHPEAFFDAGIAAYILNPLKNDYQIEDIANEYLGMLVSSYSQIFGKQNAYDAYQEKTEEYMKYICGQMEVLRLAKPHLVEKLQATNQYSLFTEIEMPLSYVLYEMEQEGVLVRPQELKEYGETLVGRIEELEQAVWEKAGEQFNINSPKQLGEILFQKLSLPGGKKTKTGYSTAADVLEKMAPEYPIVSEILEYRALTKLKSTYADGLANYIDEDNRIRSTFNQTITATGRISSTEPNLQNIPIRTELGRQLRKVFVPKQGYTLMDADYSQIELRVLASMSEDEELIEAYKQDADIHRITASKVFHVPPSEVTDLQRRNAKAVNFGIVYGISSFGLSQDLSISRKEAQGYIEKYFETYPGIKRFLDDSVTFAKENGYSITMFGRRRPIPELSSGNFMQRSFGERVAMNAPIQGTAADIIKIAMIRVAKRLREEDLKSKLILQVHDELLIETALDEIDTVKQIMEEEMKQAAELAVTLEIDLHTGDNWYDAH